MKLIVVLLVGLGLVLPASGPAAAGTERVERTVQGKYGAYPTPVTGCNEVLGPWACLIVQTRSTETFFSASVADTHGQPVLVNVMGEDGWLTSFCGKTTRPVAFRSGTRISFDVGQGRAPWTDISCPQHVVKTTGTITVTLSNRP